MDGMGPHQPFPSPGAVRSELSPLPFLASHKEPEQRGESRASWLHLAPLSLSPSLSAPPLCPPLSLPLSLSAPLSLCPSLSFSPISPFCCCCCSPWQRSTVSTRQNGVETVQFPDVKQRPHTARAAETVRPRRPAGLLLQGSDEARNRICGQQVLSEHGGRGGPSPGPEREGLAHTYYGGGGGSRAAVDPGLHGRRRHLPAELITWA